MFVDVAGSLTLVTGGDASVGGTGVFVLWTIGSGPVQAVSKNVRGRRSSRFMDFPHNACSCVMPSQDVPAIIS
jgi:hypothetical protein